MTKLIDINKLKVVPDNQKKNDDLELCIYGQLPEDIQEWLDFHNLPNYIVGNYTNIVVPKTVRVKNLFSLKFPFQYMDGFSPNLNKHLHIGHFSNLVFAKAIKKLGMAKTTISIYGDTQDGEVKKEDAIKKLNFYFDNFDYHPDQEFYASEMKLESKLLQDGQGEYEGCKIFIAGEQPVVGVKSDGSTSYFYQDICLSEKLNDSTLYITGKEQSNHFALVKKIVPHIEHLPLGLLKVNGKKMGNRFGNVIFIHDMIDEIAEELNFAKDSYDLNLIYNIFAGLVLRTTPESDKNIDMDSITSLNSPGFYLSYTMARMDSAGVKDYLDKQNKRTSFHSNELEMLYMKSCNMLRPNLLFTGLLEHCNKINSLYQTHTIKGNQSNLDMFSKLLSDLCLGAEKLGLFYIPKIEKK